MDSTSLPAPTPRADPRAALVDALGRGSLAVADALLVEEDLMRGVLRGGPVALARTEALHLAGVDPRTRAHELTSDEARRVVGALAHLTTRALGPDGRWRRRIHERSGEPCPRCGTNLLQTSGREPSHPLCACPRCQSVPAERSTRLGHFRIGCAVWSFPGWLGSFYPSGAPQHDLLRLYAERMTTVEGNTTFYAVPTAEVVERWAQATPSEFRFVFKLPRAVTHEGTLMPRARLARDFMEQIAPLGERLGTTFAQLPRTYGPELLDDLTRFVDAWPEEAGDLAVEVRNPDWFTGSARPRLVERLAARGIGLVTLDTRPIYAQPSKAPDPQADLRRRKPDLPVLPQVSGPCMVRFVAHPDLPRNDEWLSGWADRIVRWLVDGRDVSFFAHCPEEEQSPWVARAFQAIVEERMAERGEAVPPLPWNAIEQPARQGQLF